MYYKKQVCSKTRGLRYRLNVTKEYCREWRGERAKEKQPEKELMKVAYRSHCVTIGGRELPENGIDKS